MVCIYIKKFQMIQCLDNYYIKYGERETDFHKGTSQYPLKLFENIYVENKVVYGPCEQESKQGYICIIPAF